MELLKQLADKLGTTTEYLWAILLRQAPISATVDLALFILSLITGYVLYRIHRWAEKEDKYGEYDFGLPLAMGVAVVIWGVWFIAGLVSIEYIVAGYFNPEYWALHKILKAIGK